MAMPDATSPPTTPYLEQGDALLGSLITANLYDGSGTDTSQPGAFVEALVPSAGGLLWTNKTTAGNAMLLAGTIGVEVGASSSHGRVIGPLLAALLQQDPAHSSLLTVIADAQGRITQNGYLRASSRDYGLAAAFSADGGAGGQEPDATSYHADALAAVVEALVQRWRERPNSPLCSF
jgi:hypothetical protein